LPQSVVRVLVGEPKLDRLESELKLLYKIVRARRKKQPQ
jgi:hypothetical protein